MTPSDAVSDEFAHFSSEPGNKIEKLAELLLKNGRAEVSGLIGGSAFLLSCLVRKHLQARLLYISDSKENCEHASRAISVFTGEKPAVADGADISSLVRAKNARFVCADFETVAEKTVSPFFLESASVRVKTSGKTDRDELIRHLTETGYKKKEFARVEGEISVRGAIVDVTPAGGKSGLRIEFSGSRVRSLREFDTQTQMSSGRTEEARIFPFRTDDECIAESSIFDYCGENTVMFIENSGGGNILDSLENQGEKKEKKEGAPERLSAGEMEREIEKRKTVFIKTFSSGEIDFQTSTPPVHSGGTVSSAGKMLGAAKILQNGGYKLKLFAANENELEKLRNFFIHEGVDGAQFYSGFAGGGFVFPEIGTAFLNERDFAEKIPSMKTAPRTKSSASSFESDFGDMKNGDMIVHREFGIGIFRGLRNLTIRNETGDFIECEYHGGDSVYVPVSKFRLLHRYAGNEDGSPKIDKLGGSAWKKTVKNARRATETVAKELLELYARRKSGGGGHSFSKPDLEFKEFEMDFLYEETPDQKKAIEDVMEDMESPRPMDRLICGDTGFGKTEVALRAALKAVMDGFQVAFIAPTTLLASQHLQTARKRLEKFPVNTVAFSRFTSPGEEKTILREIESGTADIVIGTHKLLGNKIKFRNLGLLIIDEEHKFGVRHKEKLKSLKRNPEVLSLSATPIPRTLQLSLAGIRDISVINSPPVGRLPVKMEIRNWDGNLIRNLIMRETGRGGGVFFIHNRIESIGNIMHKLKKIAPGISMETAHGRMGKKEIENKVEKFASGEVDMLVSTAIVESGLDITRANTIIINDAHTFGIADLYQLKGRVGRGKEQAFACLLVPDRKSVGEEAWKRLGRFAELWDFGSGYELAFSDLRMRGVGNLFGVEQSGHVAGVGIEFYLEMLREAVEKIKTGKTRAEVEPEIKTKIESRIPENYVESGRERLVFYKRISSSSTISEVNRLKEEIRDRFGPVPGGLNNLLALAALKTVLKKHSVGFMEIGEDSAALYAMKDRSDTRALFSKCGESWKVSSVNKFPPEAAKSAARLLSSIKTVQGV